MTTVKLNGPFSMDSILDEYDVVQMKRALNKLGYYLPYDKTGITDMADAQIFECLKDFQTSVGLTPSGSARDGDETIKFLNLELAKPKDGYYIWRTVEDGNVRASHAELNRTILKWDDAPNPGDDYNCRCWAEPVPDDIVAKMDDDAIYPSLGPIELLAGGVVLNSAKLGVAVITRTIAAILRDVEWIRNVPTRQLQKKFKHAEVLGVKGSQNKQSLAAFKKALEDHIKSPDTKVIKGTYHKKPATHYYNPKTGINVIRGADGEYISNWKLRQTQVEHILKNGNLGGN